MITLPMNKAMTAITVTERVASGAVIHTDHAVLVSNFFANQPLATLETVMDKSTNTKLLTRIASPFDSL